MLAARRIDIDTVRTVCLALGPYRNLTTLTGSLLFLHPNCQVLNHAGPRIFGDPRIDFLAEYDRERFHNFVRYAVQIAKKGRRGRYGGSITHSHAFAQKHKTGTVLRSAAGKRVKRDIRCLFWKESLRTANHIREHGTDLDEILSRNKRLRFLLPIRHPLDCAVSNLKTGHVDLFPNLDRRANLPAVVDGILDEFAWFFDLEQRWPDRFFHFFEHGFDRAMLADLADFLQLPRDGGWMDRAVEAFEIKSGYEHDRKLVEHFRTGVARRFGDRPEIAEPLVAFVADEDRD